MSLELVSLPNRVGVELRGLDPERIDPADEEALREAFLSHSVLLLRGARLSRESHVALTRALGEPEIHPMVTARIDEHPEIIVPRPYGAEDTDDPEQIVGRIPWHADQTYTQRPCRGALLRAIEIPAEGGETGFVDTAAVYAALPETSKAEIEGLEAVHRLSRGRRLLGLASDDVQSHEMAELFPGVVHPLVLVDPASGIRSLDISPMFVCEIAGWPPEGSEVLLERLRRFATEERFVYWHHWQPDDLVIWNNYRTLHCAAGHKKKFQRTMNRTTLEGEIDGRLAA
jgi:taurine dioxygenase